MTTPTALLTPPGALYEQAAQFQADLGARQQAAVDQVLAAHAEVYARVRVEYEAVLAKIAEAQEAGKPITPAWLYQRTRLKHALATTKTEIAGLAEYASDQVKQAQWAAIQASLKYAAKAGNTALAETGVSASFLEIDPEVMRHLVGFLEDGTPLDALLTNLGLEASDQIRRALIQGVSLGKGIAWMRARVDQGLDLPRWRIETILRTESMRASRSATRQGYLANADVLAGWVWTATLDGRVCPCCLVMDGTVHPLHAVLDGHPRCRCAMVPRTKTFAELLGEDEDELPDSRPPLRSGKAWLQAQSPATQRALLGPGKWKAWTDGQIDLDDLVARTENPHWGTMRRERSLREIRKGVHANYPDQEAQPEPAPEFHPQPHIVQMMVANFSVEEAESLLNPNSGDPQHQANLKAALATLLNDGPPAGPTLPEADADVVDAWVAKMNAAVEAKGYPSKGYSQTVAIYKARANGTPGTKVGIIQSLTWQDKINAQEALARHQEYLETWVAEQAAKVEATKAAKAAAQQVVWTLEQDLAQAKSHQEALDAIDAAFTSAGEVPADDGVGKRLDDYIAALVDGYAQARLEVLDLKTLQGPLWKSDEGGLDWQMVLDENGWGHVTLAGNPTPTPIHPVNVLKAVKDPQAGWAVHYEPDPDKVKALVNLLSLDGVHLDEGFALQLEQQIGSYPDNGWDGQHLANSKAALAQAKATLLPKPDPDAVKTIVESLQQDEAAWKPIVEASASGQYDQQSKSNALEGLRQYEDWKVQQATQPDPLPYPIDAGGLGSMRIAHKIGLGESAADPSDTVADILAFEPDDPAHAHALKVGLHLASVGAPRWNVGKWEHHKAWVGVEGFDQYLTDADRDKIAGFLADLKSGKTKPATMAKSIGPNNVQGNKAKHAALTRYYWEQADLGIPAQYADQADHLKPQPGDSLTLSDGQVLVWNPSWPEPDPDKVEKIIGQVKDPAQGSWTEQTVAASIEADYLPDDYHANYWSALKALEGEKGVPAPGTPTPPVVEPPGPAPGPFGNPPDVTTLRFTGQTLGTHGAKVYEGPDGQRWLYKPPKDPRDQFLVDADVAASVLQVKSGLPAPETFAVEIGGQRGSIQRMFDAQPAFAGGFRPNDLSQDDLLAVQKQHVLDWLLANHDGHLEQFLRRPDGSLVGIDKGQAFRWLGQDRLDWNFHPNGYYGAPPPVYNALWSQFAQGGAVEVLDPRAGPLAEFISDLEDLADDDLRALFRPYAEKAAARGLLAKHGQPQPGLTTPSFAENDVNAFLDALVARKNGLGDAFTDLWDRAAKDRAKNKPGWKPTKAAPTKAQQAKAAMKALKGAPEPVKPDPPLQPEDAATNLFDSWMQKAEARYQANPNKAKANLQATANWPRFERILNLLDRSAVQELKDRQYLDDALAAEALDLIDQAEAVKAAAQANYAQRYAIYERELAAWAQQIERWRKANGIVIKFAGMDDGVLRHDKDRDGVQWADSVFDKNRYTQPQRGALNDYTGGIYSTWNGYLRSHQGDPGPYKATLDKIDAAMKVQPAPVDVILHRGTDADAFTLPNGQRLSSYGASEQDLLALVGTIQRDEAYMSSSVGNSAAFSSYKVQIKFRVPKGTPMAYVRAFSRFSSEREVVIGRGTSYYVHAVYKVGSQYVMEAEIVPEGWTPPLNGDGKPITQPSSKPWRTVRPDGTA